VSRPVADARVEESRRYFSLLSVVIKVRGDMEGNSCSSEMLFDPFFFQFELPLGQKELLLLSLNAPPLTS